MRRFNEDIVAGEELFSNGDFAMTDKVAKCHHYESSSDEDDSNYLLLAKVLQY